MENTSQIAVFEQKQIRRVEHEGEVWFSIIDIIEVLSESTAPSKYWTSLKRREPQVSTICRKLKLLAPDGKSYPSDCANTEGVLRIIMSIPSPKAEPFKLWLAQVGKQQIDETIDPELGFDRLTELYQAKGYPDEWIARRLQSIKTRKELTEEWKSRGVKDNQEYAILTSAIAKGTFGLTPKEHGQLKGLEKQNLRDHMTDFELIFTALGEAATRTLAVRDDAQGFNENHDAATEGGRMAGDARKNFEKNIGQPVVSKENFLDLPNKKSQNELSEPDEK